MKINVQVKTRSKKEGIEKLSEVEYVVRVNTPPVDGKANKRVLEILADYFNRPPSTINLVRGAKSKLKVFEIPDN